MNRIQYGSSNAFAFIPHGPMPDAPYVVRYGSLQVWAPNWCEALDAAALLTGIDRCVIEDEGAWVEDDLFVGGFDHREFSIESEEA